MIVVSNTSPIYNLAVVGELDLLEQLYGRLLIPHAVAGELSALGVEQFDPGTPSPIRWIEVQAVSDNTLVGTLLMELDVGEAEAVVLALEAEADLVLLDERIARKIASRSGLRLTGVLGILVEAKRKKIIPLVKPLLDAIVAKAGFWIGKALYEAVLQEAGE